MKAFAAGQVEGKTEVDRSLEVVAVPESGQGLDVGGDRKAHSGVAAVPPQALA